MAMSGISFLTLATGSGAGVSGGVAGVFGVSLMGRVYTTQGVKGELFKRFQRGTLRVCFLARSASQKIDRFSDGHGDAKIKAHPFVITGRAGHFFKPVGNIRLCALVEFHICVDGEGVVAFSTDAAPFTICLHGAFIDPKA